MTEWIFERLFGQRIARDTERRVTELASAPILAGRSRSSASLRALAAEPGPHVLLGATEQGDGVRIPLELLMRGHSIVTGGSGAGKTVSGLLLLESLIENLPARRDLGLAVLDPKSDLYLATLFLLARRLETLSRSDVRAAREFRKRIVIVDFGLPDPISQYNLLVAPPGVDAEFFVEGRADLLCDLLPGGDGLSLGAVGVLKKLLSLLSEFGLPITAMERILADEPFRHALVARSHNSSVVSFFATQFQTVPKATLAAIGRRVDGLFQPRAFAARSRRRPPRPLPSFKMIQRLFSSTASGQISAEASANCWSRWCLRISGKQSSLASGGNVRSLSSPTKRSGSSARISSEKP
jgi:hypothetical protein